jgi:hypothetical protein
LSGNGNAEPLGILNNTNANQVTFGATATRLKTIAFQDALTADSVGNTPDASLGYVTSFAVASKWQQIAEVSTFPRWLWDGNQWSGTVAGLPAKATNNVTNNRVVCGDWTKLAVAIFGEAIEILADPFAQKKLSLVEFLATALVDTAPINPSNSQSAQTLGDSKMAFTHPSGWRAPTGNALKSSASSARVGGLAVRFSGRSMNSFNSALFAGAREPRRS